MKGPVPNRSDQRRRRNTPDQPITTAEGYKPFIPAGDPNWHPLATAFYDSLEKSGQSVFYEASDWAYAQYVCEAMSRNLNNGRFSAQLFQAVLSGMTSLLATEGDRRRMRVELEKVLEADPDAEAAAAFIEQYAATGGISE